MDIKVKDIIKICDAQLVYGSEEEICQNFSKDTREIKKDDVYIGIKGENFDGNALYEKALAGNNSTTKGVDASEDDAITLDNIDQIVSFAKEFAKKTNSIIL